MRLDRLELSAAWRSEEGNWVWTVVLEEHAASTRLVSRNRFRLPTSGRPRRDDPDGTSVTRDGEKMLRGIGRRAALQGRSSGGW